MNRPLLLRFVVVLLVAVALLATAAAMSASGQSRVVQKRGLIAFEDLNGGLYVIRPDGTGLRRLPTGGGFGRTPSCAPDGASLVFDSYRDWDGTQYLSVLKLGAGRPKRLVRVPGDGAFAQAAWAPNGQSLTFSVYSDIKGFSAGGIYLLGR